MRTVPAPAQGVWFDAERRTEHLLAAGEEVPAGGGFLWVDVELPAPDAVASMVASGLLPAFALAGDGPAGEVSWTFSPEGVHLVLAGARLHEDALILDRLRVVATDGVVASLHSGIPGHHAAIRSRYGGVFPEFARSHGFLLYEIAGHLTDRLQAAVRGLGDRIDLLRLSVPRAGDQGEAGSELIGSVLLLRRVLVRTRDVLAELSSRRLAGVPESTQPFLGNIASRLDGLLADLAFSRDVLDDTLRAFDSRRHEPEAAPAPAPPPPPAPEVEAGRPPLRLATLGRFTVERDGQVVPDAAFGEGQARELLAALVAARGEVPRAELARWLWPALDDEAGARALHAAVAELRRALEPELGPDEPSQVVTPTETGYAVALGPRDGWDARSLLQAPARAAETVEPERRLAVLAQALELCRGPVFPGWPYAEWGRRLREECEAAAAEVRAGFAETLLQVGRPDDAVPHFEQLLAAEPDGERWHRGLMRAHHDAGRRPVALRQYHACRSALRQSRGVEPSPETQALYMELLRAG